MSNEYRVKVSVRNNLILNAIEGMGYTNLAKFSKEQRISLHSLYDMINLKSAPLLKSGEFSPFAMTLMEVFGACPTDLWTEEQLTMRLQNNSSERVLGKEAMIEALAMNTRAAIELVEDKLDREALENTVKSNIDSLTPREAKVMELRYGLNGNDEHTLEEIAEVLPKVYANGHTDIFTRERIRQIEAKALHKLRHPSRSDKLKSFLEEID